MGKELAKEFVPIGHEATYEIEDVRTFFVRRPWLARDSSKHRLAKHELTKDELAALKSRKLVLAASRSSHLRAFMDGYLHGKGRKWSFS